MFFWTFYSLPCNTVFKSPNQLDFYEKYNQKVSLSLLSLSIFLLLMGACTRGINEPDTTDMGNRPNNQSTLKTRSQVRADGLKEHLRVNGIDSLLINKQARQQINDYLNNVASELIKLMGEPSFNTLLLKLANEKWQVKGYPSFYLTDLLIAYQPENARNLRLESSLTELAKGFRLAINGQAVVFHPEISTPGLNSKFFSQYQKAEAIIVSHYMDNIDRKLVAMEYSIDDQGIPRSEVKFASKDLLTNTVLLGGVLEAESKLYAFKAENLQPIVMFGGSCRCSGYFGLICTHGSNCTEWGGQSWCGVLVEVINDPAEPGKCPIVSLIVALTSNHIYVG